MAKGSSLAFRKGHIRECRFCGEAFRTRVRRYCKPACRRKAGLVRLATREPMSAYLAELKAAEKARKAEAERRDREWDEAAPE